MVYSDSLESYNGNIENFFLRSSLLYLNEYCGGQIKLLNWSNEMVAVPVDIDVDLPTLGNKDDLDIRSKEPVLFVFSIKEYPHKAPIVFTNRTDFPKDRIAHLYVAVNSRPPAICYTRGKMDDWYSNKRIQDLVSRISNWFRDAAIGKLNENGDQFDPLRMEKYWGNIVFDYDQMVKQINKVDKSRLYFPIMFEHRIDKKKKSAAEIFVFENFITSKTSKVILEQITLESSKTNSDLSKRTFSFGSVFWCHSQSVHSNFEIDFPKNLGELKTYAFKFGISTREIDDLILKISEKSRRIPIILAVKRPKQVIGFSGEFEFISFCLFFNGNETSRIDNEITVKLLAHRQPLNVSNARRVSGDEVNLTVPIIVYGCGALGSKIVEHISRSGITPFLLVDPDELSPHNLVRHSLDSRSVGLNKASELAKKMRELFLPEKVVIIGTSTMSDDLNQKLDNWWLLDFTASTSFMNERVIKPVFNQRVIRTTLSNSGNVSYLLKEGNNGNPRVDDLEAFLFYKSISNSMISDWLCSEQKIAETGNSFLQIGVGCNSETSVLADDTISLHSALASRILKKELSSESTEGRVYFQKFNQQIFSIDNTVWSVKPFDVFKAINDEEWNIRFASGVISKMQLKMKIAQKNETGGILIGFANYKSKTIHVLDIIHLPDDSATPTHYSRGSNGLPEDISKIVEHSGGQIGYIGEWHTHPLGPENWSIIDQEEMLRIKSNQTNDVTPLPVFMTVVTKNNIYPYVI